MINYTNICRILEKTGFIKDLVSLDSPNFIQERTLLFDMWLVLRGDKHNGVTKRNLLVFLFAILGLKFQIQKEEKGSHPPARHLESEEVNITWIINKRLPVYLP